MTDRRLKILLIGEYSNVHWTLAEGLRCLGHEVCVVSDGDGWKNYRRDISIVRSSRSKWAALRYMTGIMRNLTKMKGYDIVQLINPVFFDLRANKMMRFYNFLRRHNKKVVLGAFGMDHYWVKTCLDCTTFRYSDFNIGNRQRTEEQFNKEYIRDWMQGEKMILNEKIAEDCDAIVTGLYEYDRCYRPAFPDKTWFIPFPIVSKDVSVVDHDKVRFFIGIQKSRSEYKGTDIMLRALERVKSELPDECEIVKVESVPFDEYKKLMDSCDVILDQLYSYTPAMNALQAMSQGLIVVGGGEPENYEILGEMELRPIINVLPDEEDCYNKLKDVVLHPENIHKMKLDSIEYIRRHHDHLAVAKKYSDLYNQLLS